MKKSNVGLIATIATSLLLAGCASAPHWMKVNCGWTGQVLPIRPSRQDKLTLETQRQILAANEAQDANCRD
jgi:outer membrane murein-binding lipoprotein Lpp